MGDSFLKDFLTLTTLKAQELGLKTVSPEEVRRWDFSATEVRREWRNIDVTVLNPELRFVGVVENKVHSREHSNQLQRYRKTVESRFPDYVRHYVLLNVTGDEPSDSEYLGVTYEEICEIVDGLLKSRSLDGDLGVALSHYVNMVRRRVMPDTEIQELCREIYRKHKAALDLNL